MAIFPLVVIVLSLALAAFSMQRVARYAAGGMPGAMAAMMAAMGTGLSVGYATGMVWDLGWATLLGVVAGGLHGFWMGRRMDALAALHGFGGGIMGGLMGPMLAVMLLYLDTSLLATAILMIGLQTVFTAGGLYLAATAAGAIPSSGWLLVCGRLLEERPLVFDPRRDYYAVLGVPPDARSTAIAQAFLQVMQGANGTDDGLTDAQQALAVLSDPLRRARYDVARLQAMACCTPLVPLASAPVPESIAAVSKAAVSAVSSDTKRARRAARRAAARGSTRRSWLEWIAPGGFGTPRWVVGGGIVTGVSLVMLWNGLLTPALGFSSTAGTAGLAAVAPSTGTTGEVQEVAMTLQYPRYAPEVVELKRGAPVRLTMKAIGDPGCGALTLVRGLGVRMTLRPNQSSTVEFTPDRPGEYWLNCSMNMMVPAKLRVT